MNNPISVRLIFENKEQVEFGIDTVEFIRLGNVRKVETWGHISKTVDSYYILEYFELFLNEKGDALYDPFDDEDDCTTTFARVLEWDDIVSITITNEDETTEDYYMPWKGDDEIHNPFQHTTFFPSSGSLFIAIGDEEQKL